MGLFRRREPLHVRLAREGGMLDDEEPVRAAWDNVGIHGIQRAREWDTVTTVDAPDLKGDRALFVVLPGDEIVVEEGPEDLEVLAEAVDHDLTPPYRAEAVRRQGTVWAVAGRRIEVIELAGVPGTEVELTSHDGERTLLIDGERAFGSVPALERPEQSVRARRIVGEVWEIEIHPL
ncbi:MAG TPA: hypothetical protein VG265_03910 [Gaiellaceae bacterium]|jgi:hypothetical protein|nr:hypothetical protein [Gaiellaceae bacterium]